MASEAHVEVRGLTKRFGGARALADVDLTVARGTIHGLVGQNGAGKSTLGKVIAGVHRPDDGEMLVDGERVSYRSPRDALAHGVTMLAQEPTLVPTMTVIENVFLGIEAEHGLLRPAWLRQRFAELVEEAGFELEPNRRVGGLSIADQQKVELLRSVARRARLIVMDEPTAALTPDESHRLLETARHLRERGVTIVYVSHFLEEVLALVDTVSVLRDGSMVRTSPAAGESAASLVESMLGRPMELTFPDKAQPPEGAPVVLSVRGLAREPAVKDVSFELREGEILGFAGLVGSGRTEVARAIFGADRADSGEVELEGRSFAAHSPRRGIEAGLALVPESRKEQGLVMVRSVRENMMLPHLASVAHAGVISPKRERSAVAELVGRLDIRARSFNAPVSSLSGGNQQKVLFGKWLRGSPKVLLLDEPTRGVDVGAKRAIYEFIIEVAAEGMAVLLISSEHEEVLGLAHRVLVMRRGRIAAELDAAKMSKRAIMSAAFETGDPLAVEASA